jgi:phenylalanine-4-hydroxylase
MDHASWRYILKISKVFFAKNAHQKYQDGLRETGISTDRIPLIDEMDQKLRKFGWRAVAVSGFIPPAIFMEFMSKGILTIACDMRKMENLTYTPSPDIVHEAAGHAPIIADPEYADYLRHYGELAEKAIFSDQDLDVYEAIKNLSDIKEDPHSTPEMIEAAQKRLDQATAAVDHDSEATQLGRMGWWTIEYGLIGTPSNPKIYGAGLLSSVSESFDCLSDSVKKIPFSVDCIHLSYDITRPQPQLFLAPDFQTLKKGLDELAAMMAYKRGGIEGLEKAKRAKATTTAVLDSGLQISGTLVDYLKDDRGQPCYLRYQGPTQLAYQNSELENQGPAYHAHGFGTPVGLLRGSRKSPADLSLSELQSTSRLEFESGVVVEGRFVRQIRKDGRNVILVFENCTVTRGAEVLFQPEWGTFDMACGTQVTSVYGHAADRNKYLEATGELKQAVGKPKTNLTAANRELNELYAQVRQIRNDGKPTDEAKSRLQRIWSQLNAHHGEDWLLPYELLELNSLWSLQAPWENTARSRLQKIAQQSTKQKRDTIMRGMELL